jgi:hypothetical protein
MINFMTKVDAEKAFGRSQADYGAVFATKVATIGYFGIVREWSKNSATARAILKYVEESDKRINFVGMYGGFQCFDESADNQSNGKKEPTIYVDLHGRLSVYIRHPHEQDLKRDATINPNMQPFHNNVALLHELGHAKQFIERPEWYGFYASSEKKAKLRDSIEAKAKETWMRKLTPKTISSVAVKSGADGSGVPPPPPLMIMSGPNNTAKQVNAFIGAASGRAMAQKWFVVIDVDNMSRHEWPICRELGLPVRMNYTDLAA